MQGLCEKFHKPLLLAPNFRISSAVTAMNPLCPTTVHEPSPPPHHSDTAFPDFFLPQSSQKKTAMKKLPDSRPATSFIWAQVSAPSAKWSARLAET
jgi:hypothetical protein